MIHASGPLHTSTAGHWRGSRPHGQDGGDEREGQRHPDRALALALADRKRLDGVSGVEPLAARRSAAEGRAGAATNALPLATNADPVPSCSDESDALDDFRPSRCDRGGRNLCQRAHQGLNRNQFHGRERGRLRDRLCHPTDAASGSGGSGEGDVRLRRVPVGPRRGTPLEHSHVTGGQLRCNGTVTLPREERDISRPLGMSGRCDRGPPRGHRRSAKRAVRLG